MICHIDCSNITDAKAMHQILAQFLDFPEWYGYNLDALYDCITELPCHTHLYLNNWNKDVPWATGFEAVLTDAQESCPDLTVVF